MSDPIHRAKNLDTSKRRPGADAPQDVNGEAVSRVERDMALLDEFTENTAFLAVHLRDVVSAAGMYRPTSGPRVVAAPFATRLLRMLPVNEMAWQKLMNCGRLFRSARLSIAADLHVDPMIRQFDVTAASHHELVLQMAGKFSEIGPVDPTHKPEDAILKAAAILFENAKLREFTTDEREIMHVRLMHEHTRAIEIYKQEAASGFFLRAKEPADSDRRAGNYSHIEHFVLKDNTTVVFNEEARTVERDGRAGVISVTRPVHWQFLKTLASRCGHWVSKDELLNGATTPSGDTPTENTLNNSLSMLSRQLHDIGLDIETKTGLGRRLVSKN